MSKHNGRVVEQVLEEMGINAGHLASLLDSNKATVERFLKNGNLDWSTITIIGRVIGHDFSCEFPELAKQELDAFRVSYTISQQQEDFSDIFLIDDSEMDTIVFKLTLHKVLEGIKVKSFTTGESALNELLYISVNHPEKLPGHIFLDLKMPVMDGTRFLEHFHRLNIDPNKKVKIHVLTSSIFISERNKFLANPLVNRFISKPIKPEVIKSIFEI